MQNSHENSEITARGLDLPTFDVRNTSSKKPITLQFEAFSNGWMMVVNPFDKATNKDDWNEFESFRQGATERKMIGYWPDRSLFTSEEIEVVSISKIHKYDGVQYFTKTGSIYKPIYGTVEIRDEVPCYMFKNN